MEEFVMVLDTETANDLDCPMMYDLGFAVVRPYVGEVVETRSFVVADVFLDKELMESAYFAEKIPQYWDEIKAGKRELKRLYNVRKAVADTMRQYDIKKVFAHNMLFDYRSTNGTLRYLTASKMRWFFPYGTEMCDTLKMARATLKNNDDYGKFCFDNGLMTKRNGRKYTAEAIYKWLTDNAEFAEEHTGLEDVLIEKEILKYCLSVNPNQNCLLWNK